MKINELVAREQKEQGDDYDAAKVSDKHAQLLKLKSEFENDIAEDNVSIQATCINVTKSQVFIVANEGDLGACVYALDIKQGVEGFLGTTFAEIKWGSKFQVTNSGSSCSSLEIITDCSGEAERLIVGSTDSIKMWDLKTRKVTMTFGSDSSGQSITGLVLNQKTNTLISTSVGDVAMFDVFTGQRIKTFRGFSGSNPSYKCVDVDSESTIMVVGAETQLSDEAKHADTLSLQLLTEKIELVQWT